MTLVCVVHFSWLVLELKTKNKTNKKNEYESLFYKKKKRKKVTFFLFPKSENQIVSDWMILTNSCDF